MVLLELLEERSVQEHLILKRHMIVIALRGCAPYGPWQSDFVIRDTAGS